ncbi:MAG: glutathione S-transferase family protein [Hyphomicrobiales bacterium]|jgi:glutathione S-transferase|nr:glutathione S-transferase family protein [Hyphomicrobiales bacterium]
MTVRLYYHPLASFCWKALIALYENETPFEPILVDLGDEASRAAFLAVYPVGKFPVIEEGGRIVPGSSSVIEYLAAHHPGKVRLVPEDADAALDVRIWDRFHDSYVHEQMQKIVLDRLRPEDQTDPTGVAQAREQIRSSYALLDREMADREWAAGEWFSMADCAAAPALFYANKVEGIGPEHDNVTRYLDRLKARPSFARVLAEAEPYFKFFPARPGDN